MLPQYRDAMDWLQISYALRTLWHLFRWRGPALALFWLASVTGLAWPTPLALALALHLVLRFAGNLPRARQTHMVGRGGFRTALAFLALLPVLTLLAPDGLLMVAWSVWALAFALMLWWMPEMRAQEAALRPPPIDDTDVWLDMRGWVLLAGAAVGLALSLTGDPAIWITGTYLGAAALDLTGLLYLRSRGRV